MDDRKKLAIVIAALFLVFIMSFVFYNGFKDRVDPMTGELLSQAMEEATVRVNTPAPDFTMQDSDGKEVKLSEFKGKPVVLNFWTSWCSFCKEEMPYFETAYKEHGQDVQFIMLNVAKSERTEGEGQKYIQSSNYTFPVFYENEGKVMNLYGLRGFPATIFIDKNGNIAERNIGIITQDKLNEKIKALIAE